MKILAITGKIGEKLSLLKFVHKIDCYRRSKWLLSLRYLRLLSIQKKILKIKDLY